MQTQPLEPWQAAVAPEQAPSWLQGLEPRGTRPGSLVSISPLQSLSRPSQISTPVTVQGYSQPSLTLLLRSTQPSSHTAMAHLPATHLAIAWGIEQAVQPPQ